MRDVPLWFARWALLSLMARWCKDVGVHAYVSVYAHVYVYVWGGADPEPAACVA